MSLDGNSYYKLKAIGQYKEGKNKEKLVEVYYQKVNNYSEVASQVNPIFEMGEELIATTHLRRLPILRIGSIYKGEGDSIVRSHNDLTERVPRGWLNALISSGEEYVLSDLIDFKDDDYFTKYKGLLECKVWVFSKTPFDFEKPRPGNGELDLVLIPTYEIIRFYFGQTSNLISALFNGGLHTEEIFYRSLSYYKKEGTDDAPFVMLGKKMKDKCAKTVGRILFDATAYKNAVRIHDSLIAQKGKGYNKYPSSGFPFADETRLLVNYQKLNINIKSKIFDRIPGLRTNGKIVLVTEVLSCSHGLPFTALDFLRINDARSIVDELKKNITQHPPRKRKRRKKEPTEETDHKSADVSPLLPPIPEINDEDARDGDMEDEIVSTKEAFEQFPNIRFEAIKRDKIDQKTTRKIITEWINNIRKRTRGEGKEMESGILGVDYELDESSLDGETEKDFEAIIDELNELGINTFDCELNGGVEYSYFPLSKIKDRDKIAYEWCFIMPGVNRKCFLAECRTELATFYVLDIQRRLNDQSKPKEHGFMIVFSDEGRRISDSDLNSFLMAVALQQGILKWLRGYGDWNLFGVRHLKGDTPKERAERIISKITGSK